MKSLSQYPSFSWVFCVDVLLKYQAISKTIFTLSLKFKRISSGFETHCKPQAARMSQSACQVWKLSTGGENEKWARLVSKSWMRGERGWGLCGDTEPSATCHLTRAPQKLLSSQPDWGTRFISSAFFWCFSFWRAETALEHESFSLLQLYKVFFYCTCTSKTQMEITFIFPGLPREEQGKVVPPWGWGKSFLWRMGGGEGVHKHSLYWTTNPRLYSILCLHQSLGMEDGGESWRPPWLHRSTLFSCRDSLGMSLFLYTLLKEEMMGTSNTRWSLNLEMQRKSPALSPNPDKKLTIFCSVHISVLTNRPNTAGPFQVCKDCW